MVWLHWRCGIMPVLIHGQVLTWRDMTRRVAAYLRRYEIQKYLIRGAAAAFVAGLKQTYGKFYTFLCSCLPTIKGLDPEMQEIKSCRYESFRSP